MKDLEIIFSLDHEIFEQTNPYFSDLVKQVKDFAHKRTFSNLIMFNVKSEFLKNGIFDLCRTDGIYGAKILFRSLIEHALKAAYLNMRYTMERSDLAAEEFELFSELSEDFEYGKAWKDFARRANPEALKKDLWELLQGARPEYAKYTPKQLEEKVSQFKYKNIIRFIDREFSKVEQGLGIPFLRLIPQYSELSSFVHGGPFADSFVKRVRGESDRNFEAYKVCDEGLAVSLLVKRITFSSALYLDEKYHEALPIMDRLVKKHQDDTLNKSDE